MVFKNVELRLDVLQEELGLPLVFTRGITDELDIYVGGARLRIAPDAPATTGVGLRSAG